MKFFIYSRKSVLTEKGDSIENQIEMCRQYLFSKFPETSEEDITVYEDEGFSAKNTDRPRFQQMLKDLKTQKPQFIVCYRLDRISRNVSDFSALIESLNRQNISFICIKEEFDTSKPMGKAMMYIASVFAQLERETIAERVRDNMRMLARTGRWLGGTPPLGYTSEKAQEMIVDGRMKTSCRLREKEAELAVVKTIFQKFLETRSLSAVSRHLASAGIQSRNGRFYSPLSIKLILKNPVYCTADRDAFSYFKGKKAEVCFEENACSAKNGLLAYSKRDYTQKNAPRQPVEKWIVAIGRHSGLIPGKTWVTVQNILNGKENPHSSFPPHNHYALLSGLLCCKNCGARMFAKARSGQPGMFDYICHTKLRGGVSQCGMQNLNGPLADQAAWESVKGYRENGEIFSQLLRSLLRTIQAEGAGSNLEKVHCAIKRKNKEADSLIKLLSHGNLNAEFIERANSRFSEIEQELLLLCSEKERLTKEALSEKNSTQETKATAKALANQAEIWQKATVAEKRAVLQTFLEKILWDGFTLELYGRRPETKTKQKKADE